MSDPLAKSGERKPFKTRLLGSLIVWLILTTVIGGIGFFVWMARGRDELEGAKLPPVNSLSLTNGKITRMNYHGLPRRGTFVYPTIEFQDDDKIYQLRTINSYSSQIFPFQQNQTVEILFVAHEPEKAWLKWEYDLLIEEYESFGARLPEYIKLVYFFLGSSVIVISGLLLLTNLFVPLFRFWILDFGFWII